MLLQPEEPRVPPPENAPAVGRGPARIVTALGLVLAAVLLSAVFWFPLWTGGGLVGSDIYAYYLPQKSYYAERLRAGELPLWNNLIGHGYPQLAESQTGVFYPLHLALYPLFDLNTAYSTSVIVHYVLTFVFTAMYARKLGLSIAGAGLAALVYTYGWFPPRLCNEWSIIGGTWMPLALWCVESFLTTRWWRYLFLLTGTLAVQMLAGHFMLAFVTQLVLAGYVPLRLWFSTGDLSAEIRRLRRRMAVGLAMALLAAFALAAVQLLPTWELKQLSQRATLDGHYDPAFGSIPPKYFSQIALPWVWYPDASSFDEAVVPRAARTNRVEAHLYFGLIPLALAVWWICRLRLDGDRRILVWIILGLAGLVLAGGWLVPVLRHLPGFGFFEGAGRYGVITTLAAAILAGSGLDSLLHVLGRRFHSWHLSRVTAELLSGALAIAVFAGTTFDLHLVSRLVTHAVLVKDPPANHIADSPLRRELLRFRQPARIVSEGKNLPSLLGVATIPTYLGLGPVQYVDPKLTLPEPWPFHTPPTREQLDWFHRAGLTHYLSFRPVDRQAWSARLVWEGEDPFLNAALARRPGERLYLYELDGSRGRVDFLGNAAGQSARVVDYGANRVVIETDSTVGGRLILTDLAYPGWVAAVDGQPADSLVAEKMYRAVDLSPGAHSVTWTYHPATLYWGAAVSLSTVVILLALGHVRFWHQGVFSRLIG
jgi:hypothetical protein